MSTELAETDLDAAINDLPAERLEIIQSATDSIRQIVGQQLAGLYDAGKHLHQLRLAFQVSDHESDTWLAYIDRELSFGKSQAYNLIGVYQRFKGQRGKLASLNASPTALIELASAKTTDEQIDAAFDRAGTEALTVDAVREIQGKPPKKKARSSALETPAESARITTEKAKPENDQKSTARAGGQADELGDGQPAKGQIPGAGRPGSSPNPSPELTHGDLVDLVEGLMQAVSDYRDATGKRRGVAAVITALRVFVKILGGSTKASEVRAEDLAVPENIDSPEGREALDGFIDMRNAQGSRTKVRETGPIEGQIGRLLKRWPNATPAEFADHVCYATEKQWASICPHTWRPPDASSSTQGASGMSEDDAWTIYRKAMNKTPRGTEARSEIPAWLESIDERVRPIAKESRANPYDQIGFGRAWRRRYGRSAA
ncbi:MAG: hypothetical protein AAF532_16430 [Planctomycetota bacterium]